MNNLCDRAVQVAISADFGFGGGVFEEHSKATERRTRDIMLFRSTSNRLVGTEFNDYMVFDSLHILPIALRVELAARRGPQLVASLGCATCACLAL